MKTCRECNQPYDGRECECGRKSEVPQPGKAKTVLDELATVINRWCATGDTRRSIPAQLTTDGTTAHAAAARWMLIQEPRKKSENAYDVSIAGGQESARRRIDPYVDRVRATLWTFLSLSDADRESIIGCAAEKVPWCGEPVSQLHVIYEETLDMRRIGRTAYRAKARTAARGVIKKMVDVKPSRPLDTPVASWNDDGTWA